MHPIGTCGQLDRFAAALDATIQALRANACCASDRDVADNLALDCMSAIENAKCLRPGAYACAEMGPHLARREDGRPPVSHVVNLMGRYEFLLALRNRWADFWRELNVSVWRTCRGGPVQHPQRNRSPHTPSSACTPVAIEFGPIGFKVTVPKHPANAAPAISTRTVSLAPG